MTYQYIGPAHAFYQYGESYTLHTYRNSFGMVFIEVRRGKGTPINASRQKYLSRKKFLENWRER